MIVFSSMTNGDFSQVTRITASWILDGVGCIYEAEPKSLFINRKSNSVRFDLREVNGEDDTFQVLIKEENGAYTANFDYEGYELKDHVLEHYQNGEAVLLHFSGPQEHAYFHLWTDPA